MARARVLGGNAYFEYQVRWAEIPGTDSGYERTYDREGWLIEHLFARIVIVDLSGTTTTDKDLEFLEFLGDLKELDLSETQVTGEFFCHLCSNGQLREVSLRDSEFTTSYLPTIPESVRTLDLSGTSINDHDLRHLELPNLVRLVLGRTTVTREGVIRAGLGSVAWGRWAKKSDDAQVNEETNVSRDVDFNQGTEVRMP